MFWLSGHGSIQIQKCWDSESFEKSEQGFEVSPGKEAQDPILGLSCCEIMSVYCRGGVGYSWEAGVPQRGRVEGDTRLWCGVG